VRACAQAELAAAKAEIEKLKAEIEKLKVHLPRRPRGRGLGAARGSILTGRRSSGWARPGEAGGDLRRRMERLCGEGRAGGLQPVEKGDLCEAAAEPVYKGERNDAGLVTQSCQRFHAIRRRVGPPAGVLPPRRRASLSCDPSCKGPIKPLSPAHVVVDGCSGGAGNDSFLARRSVREGAPR
jgi:hypothetical protein